MIVIRYGVLSWFGCGGWNSKDRDKWPHGLYPIGVEDDYLRLIRKLYGVWWITSNSPTNNGYSLFIVYRQCGQVVTIRFGDSSFKVSVLAFASSNNRYSFPVLHAESPMRCSDSQSAARLTHSDSKIETTVRGCLCVRASVACAHPTHHNTSGLGLSSMVGTSSDW